MTRDACWATLELTFKSIHNDNYHLQATRTASVLLTPWFYESILTWHRTLVRSKLLSDIQSASPFESNSQRLLSQSLGLGIQRMNYDNLLSAFMKSWEQYLRALPMINNIAMYLVSYTLSILIVFLTIFTRTVFTADLPIRGVH